MMSEEKENYNCCQKLPIFLDKKSETVTMWTAGVHLFGSYKKIAYSPKPQVKYI